MDKEIFGYHIFPDIYFELEKKSLINVSQKHMTQRTNVVFLRETMFRLLVFILENAGEGIIYDTTILFEVWDKYGLSSSSQRLWQVMSALKNKLRMTNAPEDLIMRVDSKGFFVRKDLITVLYCDKKRMKVRA
ncbi:DNA-binding winged helix-turn-helix (wHTH) domain-containing protein [Phytobacter palmae]|nr:DNA-binding winged helix-turn-helix (wHTH) domain-containing protein [Phytobacter palmae]